jgi:hypothetical protein
LEFAKVFFDVSFMIIFLQGTVPDVLKNLASAGSVFLIGLLNFKPGGPLPEGEGNWRQPHSLDEKLADIHARDDR